MTLCENLTKAMFSAAFSLHLPNLVRGKGQHLSDVTSRFTPSVRNLFVTCSSDVSEFYSIRSLEFNLFYICVSSCLTQICTNSFKIV